MSILSLFSWGLGVFVLCVVVATAIGITEWSVNLDEKTTNHLSVNMLF